MHNTISLENANPKTKLTTPKSNIVDLILDAKNRQNLF